MIMTKTDVPNTPETSLHTPCKLFERDSRDVALLFFITPVVEADGGKLRNSIVDGRVKIEWEGPHKEYKVALI